MKEMKVFALHMMEKVRTVGVNDEGLAVKLEVDDYEIKKRTPPLAMIRNGRVSAVKPLNKTIIALGQTFQSFDEVSRAITMYEKRHKVHLMQKYFRRIAANPKPSNKEDFMLSEEERKRFVYRWVDFCCTYFDDMLARTDHNEEGGTNNQVLGLAMKECPMRIRFQLRFNEKDLMISIFKEEHDHKHNTSDVPQMSSLPKDSNGKNPIPVASISDLKNTKRPRPPPPSLTPLPSSKFPKECVSPPSSVSYSEYHCPNSHIRHKKATFVNLRSHLQQSHTSSIPKPPPLKAMPLLSNSTETSSTNIMSSNKHAQGLSVEGVIKNIYQFLCQLQTQGAMKESGLYFTTPNPDIIKITSELSGVDAGRVLATCQPNEALFHSQNSRNTENLEKSVLGSCLERTSASSINPTINRVKITQSFSNRGFSDIVVPSANHTLCQSQIYDQSSREEESETSFVNMPVEVIIKAEPDEPVNFYDENDSDSNMDDMSMNGDYFRGDANR